MNKKLGLLHSNRFWVLSFVSIFFLSLDFWMWDEMVSLTIAGLPKWVYYFIVIQLVLVIMIYAFSKYYWGNKEDK